jgi:hypothetical protein
MTMISSVRARLSIAALAGALTLAGVAAAPKQPRIQTGANAEVTADGLVRVQKSVVDAAWVTPDFDLTPYTKLMVASAGVSYKKLKPVKGTAFGNRSNGQSAFPVKEESRTMFNEILKEAFVTELSKLQRYQIVDTAGPDVLMLAGAVIDVESNVPPYMDSPGVGIYLSSVGAATMVIEVRDSQSNEVLGRAADRRAADSPFAISVNSVTGWSEVRRLAQYWASLVRQRLEELEKV